MVDSTIGADDRARPRALHGEHGGRGARVADAEVAGEREAFKVFQDGGVRRRLRVEEVGAAAADDADAGEESALRVGEGGVHPRAVCERLHVVRHHAVQELHGLRARHLDPPARHAQGGEEVFITDIEMARDSIPASSGMAPVQPSGTVGPPEATSAR